MASSSAIKCTYQQLTRPSINWTWVPIKTPCKGGSQGQELFLQSRRPIWIWVIGCFLGLERLVSKRKQSFPHTLPADNLQLQLTMIVCIGDQPLSKVCCFFTFTFMARKYLYFFLDEDTLWAASKVKLLCSSVAQQLFLLKLLFALQFFCKLFWVNHLRSILSSIIFLSLSLSESFDLTPLRKERII